MSEQNSPTQALRDRKVSARLDKHLRKVALLGGTLTVGPMAIAAGAVFGGWTKLPAAALVATAGFFAVVTSEMRQQTLVARDRARGMEDMIAKMDQATMPPDEDVLNQE